MTILKKFEMITADSKNMNEQSYKFVGGAYFS